MENMNDTLDFDIDDLFRDDEQPVSDSSDQTSDTTNNDTDMTKAVSERINVVRRKTEKETQDRIAKDLGYESYEDLQKAKEKKLIKDAGLDEDDISGVVEQIVNKRIAEDPRMKKLEEYEAQEKNKFVTSQLDEINKLIGNNTYKSVEELPKDTLKLWETTGNLKQAFLATQGESLLVKSRSSQMNGSTNHLADPSNGTTGKKARHLNEEEKAIWRSVMPDITEEELSKKTVDVD